MSSCIFRPSRQAAFAACKKARRSSSTSPRGRKASRQKTSDLSNPRTELNCPARKTRDRAFSLSLGDDPARHREMAGGRVSQREIIHFWGFPGCAVVNGLPFQPAKIKLLYG